MKTGFWARLWAALRPRQSGYRQRFSSDFWRRWCLRAARKSTKIPRHKTKNAGAKTSALIRYFNQIPVKIRDNALEITVAGGSRSAGDLKAVFFEQLGDLDNLCFLPMIIAELCQNVRVKLLFQSNFRQNQGQRSRNNRRPWFAERWRFESRLFRAAR